jgi:hypothetical protein
VIGDHAERVDIGAPVDRVAVDLFGAHVLGRADQVRGHGRRLADLARDAEIREQGPVRSLHQDVGRLHVAVDDAAPMGEIEGGGDLAEYGHQVCPGLRLEHALAQGAPGDVGSHHVEDVARMAEVEDRQDVRVLELGDRFGLAAEAPDEVLVAGPLARQDLDGDQAIEATLVGQIDDRHTALPEEGVDSILAEGRSWLERHARVLSRTQG